ncbi:MAG: hypothetical protein ABIB93_03675 [Chloroflexota bacterium]
MKISRTSLFILVIGVLAIVFGILNSRYSSVVKERDTLFPNMIQAQKAITEITAEKHSLESQLEQVEEKLAQAKSVFERSEEKFPTFFDSIEYGKELCDVAEDCAVEVVALNTSQVAELNDDSFTYLITSFEISLKGTANDLLDYVHRIAQNDRCNCTSIDFMKMDESGGEETFLELSLTVYNYQRD